MNQDPQKGPIERPEPIDDPPDSRLDPAIKDWIKKLEKNAILQLKHPLVEHDLYNKYPYLCYDKEASTNLIHLEGHFTIEQLEALIQHIKRYQK